MSSRSGSSLSGRDRRIRGAPSRATARQFMTDRQIEAYLIARDAVRNIQRASSAWPTSWSGMGMARTDAHRRPRLDS
jgi:hypothetical protein